MSTLNMDQDRASKLAEIGSRLRQIREEKAISLEHVSAKTMIQARLLNAIEEGRLDELPEPIYTQGFIRRFAEALGLNGTEFAQDFPTRLSSEPRFRSSVWQEVPAAQLRPIHLYILYIVVIFAAVSGLSYLINRSTLDINPPAPTTSGQPVAPKTPAQPQQAKSPQSAQPKSGATSPRPTPPVAKPTQQPSQTASPQPKQPVQAEISLTEPSWVEIVVDGRVEYEGLLPQGTKRTLTAKENLTLRAGNAGGVLVATDQQPPKPMGQAGMVEELTLTPKASPTPTNPSPAAQ